MAEYGSTFWVLLAFVTFGLMMIVFDASAGRKQKRWRDGR